MDKIKRNVAILLLIQISIIVFAILVLGENLLGEIDKTTKTLWYTIIALNIGFGAVNVNTLIKH